MTEETETPELIVVKEKRPNSQVAREVYEALQAQPHDHEVASLAERLDVPPEQIVDVLHNYGPDGRGGVERRPDGAGGGWLPEEIAKAHRSIEEDPTEIGYRWPDGELREVPFDISDDEHLARMGMTRSDA